MPAEIDLAGDPKPWRVRCPSKQARDALHQAVQELLVAQVSPMSVAA